MDYQIQRSTRRCAATDRELEPGETCYSVLRESEEGLVRADYSQQGWSGPPDDALAFWKGKIPAREERKRPVFDPDLLLSLLERLEQYDDPTKQSYRYFVALLLLRRRILKFVDLERTPDGRELWVLRCSRTDSTYHVADPHLTKERLAEVEEQLTALLSLNA